MPPRYQCLYPNLECSYIIHHPTNAYNSAPRYFLCTIVYCELYYGAFKSLQVERNLAHLESLFEEFTTVSLNMDGAKLAGKIRASLTAIGTPIGSNDLLIASVAIANDLTLVTHNIREFSRVEGLKYEDWE
ncbi:PIN domain-containing protein [Leptolyngbyaceae cyanobacterium UHCC 1019]